MSGLIEELRSKLTTRRRVVFPEGDNEIIKRATNDSSDTIEPVLLSGEGALEQACRMVADGAAEAMVAGIDYTSRDVILAARDFIGAESKTFSASFVIELPDGRVFTLADCAACKNPTAEQLKDIILQTVATHQAISDQPARVAGLSFSTYGSGGRDDSIDKIKAAIELVRAEQPDLAIDGEMQLDAAVNAAIGQKKAPDSPVAGRANVLILPDLNSGNILYKAMEQFAGGKAYGPILQGFKAPISDLSRGSTYDDVLGVIAITAARLER
jgi:phosphate acetyltransferase